MNHEGRTSLAQLDIELLADGGFELKQGEIDSYDISVVLHPCQLALLASMAGFVPVAEVARACERLHDRLDLLAAMVRAHTKEGDPLRAAVAVLTGNQNSCAEATKTVDGGDGLRTAPRESGPSEPTPSIPINAPHKNTDPDGIRENLSLDLEH